VVAHADTLENLLGHIADEEVERIQQVPAAGLACYF
jgi:hypothetical protein